MGNLFGLSSASSSSGFDFSVLGDYYRAKNQVATTQPSKQTKVPNVPSALYAPWAQKQTLTTDVAKLRDALGTSNFVNLQESEINKAAVALDHKKLFAVYNGLNRLTALANKAAADSTPAGERTTLNKRFQEGLEQIKSFLSDKGFEDLTMMFGDKTSRVDTGFRKARPSSLYSGATLATGSPTTAISSLTGTEKFTVSIAKSGGTTNVAMDLSEIQGDLSVDNLISYLNGKLADAGVYTRFNRTVVNGAAPTDPKKYGLSVQTVATEDVSFWSPDAKPAVYIAGVTGAAADQTGQLIKLSDDGGSASTEFTKKIVATKGVVDVRGSATDSNGNVFVVGSATDDIDSAKVQGAQDVYLRKYDAAGHLIWNRLLGSSKSASAYSVAVDASGNVAIAGKVSDKLTPTAVGGGDDSFVAKYDAEGREVFLHQISPTTADQANAVAFTADGSLLVAGQTTSAMNSSVTQSGSTDAYLMKLGSTGTLQWVRQFGGTGDDRASALTVDASGNAVLGTVENGVAVVRKLDTTDGTSAPLWQMTLGTLGQGNLSSLVVSGSDIYAAGSTTNAALDAGGQASIVTAHAGDSDGFVTKISDAGASASAIYTTYVGTAGQEGGLGLAVNNGDVYLAGSTSGNLSGSNAQPATDAFVRKLDSDGHTVWTRQFESPSGASVARSIAVDPQGASVLDTLGLPRGKIAVDETRTVTAGSSVRAGDQFFVRVNDGPKFKITVEAGDTMRSLARKVNNTLLLKGTAEVSRAGGDGIRISAKEGSTIELIPGAAGLDALAGLGIEPVKLDATKKTTATSTGPKSFALGLKSDLSIEEKLKAGTIQYQLGTAMEVIKSAYIALTKVPLNQQGPVNLRALKSYSAAQGTLSR